MPPYLERETEHERKPERENESDHKPERETEPEHDPEPRHNHASYNEHGHETEPEYESEREPERERANLICHDSSMSDGPEDKLTGPSLHSPGRG